MSTLLQNCVTTYTNTILPFTLVGGGFLRVFRTKAIFRFRNSYIVKKQRIGVCCFTRTVNM